MQGALCDLRALANPTQLTSKTSKTMESKTQQVVFYPLDTLNNSQALATANSN